MDRSKPGCSANNSSKSKLIDPLTTSSNCAPWNLPDRCVKLVLSHLSIKERVRAERVCKQWQRVSKQMWTNCLKLNAVDFMVHADRVMICRKYLLMSDAENEKSDGDEFFECNDVGDYFDVEEEDAYKKPVWKSGCNNAAGDASGSDYEDSDRFVNTPSNSEGSDDTDEDEEVSNFDLKMGLAMAMFRFQAKLSGNSSDLLNMKRKIHEYKDYENVEDKTDPVLHPKAFKRVLILTRYNLKKLNCLDVDTSLGMSIVLPLVIQLCPKLEVLKIASVDAIPKVVKSLASKCPNLNVLCLRNVKCLNDEILVKILTKLKHLHTLDVSSNYILKGTFMNYINKSTKNINIGFCSNLSGKLVSKAIQDHKLHFHQLDLSGLKKLTDNDFKKICTVMAKSLEELTILMSNRLPNISLDAICVLKNLKHLNLENNTEICNATLNEIAKNCRKLEVVNLKDVADRRCDLDNVSGKGIRPFGLLPNLQDFDVSGVQFGDKTLDFLAKNAHKLKRLGCKDCHGISNKGVINLLSELDNLEFLNVKYCEQISITSLLETIAPIINNRTSQVPLEIKVFNCNERRENYVHLNSPMLQITLG